jgi:hypothetical protein
VYVNKFPADIKRDVLALFYICTAVCSKSSAAAALIVAVLSSVVAAVVVMLLRLVSYLFAASKINKIKLSSSKYS